MEQTYLLDKSGFLYPIQMQRQGTTSMVIPCLYLLLFTVLRTPSAELSVNKKRTRILFRKELGSSTNCMVEHQGVEPWHRSPGLSHFESLNRLDEAGFVRLSLAVAGIFCASQKWHIIAIYRQKSTTFCEVPLEKAFFHTGRQRLHFRCSCVRCPLLQFAF